MAKRIEPQCDLDAFNCPHCDAYSHQIWFDMSRFESGCRSIEDFKLSRCVKCKNYTIWYVTAMIYPDKLPVESPNTDLSKEIKEDYIEAARIVSKSPRGAAALLRLAIQKLCIQIGGAGKNLDKDIAKLVEDNKLPNKVQRALDSVRVIGNNAVHPGELDLRDDRPLAMSLFELVNNIADIMISQPKSTDSIYNRLPKRSLDAIDKRKSKSNPASITKKATRFTVRAKE